ncbi:MAG: hypothetical protein WBC85_11110 [Planktotalea sp.]|uniref:hypothetical protein n=1 Tax=Planktotalea sp. TaxID=2029877 RepID=UPI003C77184B
MPSIIQVPLPETAFLARYLNDAGAYTDCFTTDIEEPVDLENFAIAFFDTWVFRLERKILAVTLRKPSSIAQVRALAAGASDRLAAWHVVERSADQLLLAVGDGPIRTWLMRANTATGTKLYFGSAILPSAKDRDGTPKMSLGFRALLGFHKLYARILLAAARRSLS